MTATETKAAAERYARGAVLTERKREVVRFVCRHVVVSRDQIMAGRFGSLTRANTCLAELVHADLLSRLAVPICPGKGGAQALYYPGRAAGVVGEVEPEALTKMRRQIPRWSWSLVEHVLDSNELLVNFTEAPGHTPDAAMLSYNTEPELRRVLLNCRLVPDGWIAWAQGGKRFNCFTEIDLHHEGLTVWREKIIRYVEYFEAGEHQRLFGFRAFRVLVLTRSQTRLDNLRRVATQAGQLFRFAELKTVNSANILGPIWLPATGSVPLALREA